MTLPSKLDEEALLAAADLVGRSGATGFEIGYRNEEGTVPYAVFGAQWYAKAKYHGATLRVENKADPIIAAEALANRILEGGQCTHCGETVHILDGEGGCRWYRKGDKWKRGCE